jgi:hypothetical protein
MRPLALAGLPRPCHRETSTPWGFPWIFIIPAGVAFIAWLLYVDRQRLRRWIEERREERAVLRDFRSRRRAATTTHHR